MDSSTVGPLKPRLLALVAQGVAEQQAFIAGLSAAQRAAVGAPDAWAAKDHLAHTAAWKGKTTRLLVAAVRGETPAPSPDDSEFNPRVFTAQQHQPWDAVLADLETAYAALRAALEACSDADLIDPARFPWRKGHPLWYPALVDGYEHLAEHYAQFYREAGDVGRATAVREAAVETARRLVGETAPFGYMLYNLGCFYAQTGRPAQALAALRDALPRAAELRTWLPADAELAPLHADPAFQALLAEAAGPAPA